MTLETDSVARRAMLSPILRAEDFSPLSASVRVNIGAQSRRGDARAHNEDHYLVAELSRQQRMLLTSLPASDLPAPFDEHAYAMLVADGLGGTGRGGVASRVALSTLAHMVLRLGKWNVRVDPQVAEEIIERAERLYQHADQAVLERSRVDARLAGMATTLTAAYSAGDCLFIANVGHSRAYLFREGALTQLTRDHTLAEHFADYVGPSPVDRGIQDLRHILTDTIGGNAQAPLVEVDQFLLKDGDHLLLCTNGVTDALDNGRIAELLARRRDPSEQCDLLLDCAADASGGSGDNMTVVLAEYQIPPRKPEPEPLP